MDIHIEYRRASKDINIRDGSFTIESLYSFLQINSIERIVVNGNICTLPFTDGWISFFEDVIEKTLPDPSVPLAINQHKKLKYYTENKDLSKYVFHLALRKCRKIKTY